MVNDVRALLEVGKEYHSTSLLFLRLAKSVTGGGGGGGVGRNVPNFMDVSAKKMDVLVKKMDVSAKTYRVLFIRINVLSSLP